MTEADIIVDQLRAGHYGTLGAEGMAMGKTVLVWISDWAAQFYPEPVPVVVANPETVTEKLRMAICDRDLRDDLRIRGRRYAERYHDARRCASHLLRIYAGEGVTGDPIQMWW